MRLFIAAIMIIGLLVPLAGCRDYNSELAPIHDVDINISEGDPASVSVTIQYGLPNGCYLFDRTKVVEITGGYDIGVWIKIPSDAQACTEIYGMGETTVDLGRKFEPGESYTIRVNGVDREVTIPGNDGGTNVIIKPAPIVSVDVRIAESFPPQVFIDIRGILTDGCTTLNETDVTRQGNVIDINVTTQRPEDAVCIQVISYFDTVVPLGSEFVSGEIYTLRVNGKSQQFSVDSGVLPGTVEPSREPGVPTPVPPPA